jgi:hypothetical protein
MDYTDKSTLTLIADPPPFVPAQQTNYAIFGPQGFHTYYYWIVSKYPIGNVMSTSIKVAKGPNILTASNYVTIVWNAIGSETGFDILRTDSPSYPNGVGNYLVASVGSTVTRVNDISPTTTTYTVNLAGTIKGTIELDNESYSTPVFIPSYPILNSILWLLSTNIQTGAGTPEGSITAPVGSLWLRTDGGVGTTLYVKEVGSGNVGWTAIASAGASLTARASLLGTKDGLNDTFTINTATAPTKIVVEMIVWNGVVMQPNVGYVRLANSLTVTMQPGYIPTGDAYETLESIIFYNS